MSGENWLRSKPEPEHADLAARDEKVLINPGSKFYMSVCTFQVELERAVASWSGELLHSYSAHL